jgi:hypothetical protein
MKKRFSRGWLVGVVALLAGAAPLVLAVQPAQATACSDMMTTIDIAAIVPTTAGGTTQVDASVTFNGAPDSTETVAFTQDGVGAGATTFDNNSVDGSSGPANGKPPGDYVVTATAGNQSVHVTATILPGGAGQAGCQSTALLTVSGPPNNVSVQVVPGALPAKPKPGDSTSATVTAHVTDSNGANVGNENVTFSAPSPSNSDTFGGAADNSVPAKTETVATDANGEATATVNSDSTVGNIKIQAQTEHGSVIGFTFLDQYGDPATTSGDVTPNSIPADGSTTTTGTAFVKDSAGDAVQNATVTFSTNDNDIVLNPTSGKTGANGKLTTSIKASKSAGPKKLFIFVSGGQNQEIPFTLTQPAGTTQLTLNPATIPADGATTSVATASVLDGAGSPKSGVNITFSTNGDTTINPTTAVTGADGKATTTITASKTADKETITASGDNGQSGTATLVESAGPLHGYWFVASDGGIFNYGDTGFYGSEGGTKLPAPIVGVAATSDHKGYWLVGADGSVYTHGDASFQGSLTGKHLNKPIVGIAGTPSGNGYWLVASDGGIFNYGDAKFFGSAGGAPLNKPVVGMTAAADGNGYWLVASDGGIFNYGPSSNFKGSTGSIKLNSPVVGMAAAPDGSGYWLVAADGGIFTYGPQFRGSMGGQHLNKPVVGMSAASDNSGYWLVASDGGIFAFGAPFKGSAGGSKLNQPINGMSGF